MTSSLTLFIPSHNEPIQLLSHVTAVIRVSSQSPSGLQTILPDSECSLDFSLFFFFSRRTTLMQRQSVIKRNSSFPPQTKSAGPVGIKLRVSWPWWSVVPYAAVSLFRSVQGVRHTHVVLVCVDPGCVFFTLHPTVHLCLNKVACFINTNVQFPSRTIFLSPLMSIHQ